MIISLTACLGLAWLALPAAAQTIQPIYSFIGATNPYAALTLGSDGNFYGTTQYGGSGGAGTVFRMTTNGTLTVLANFANTNGAHPRSTLVFGPDGNLYGTTTQGGSSPGVGTVFKITTNGTLTTLATFGATNGANPNAGLALGPDGNFYGTTSYGGSNNVGTVFQITTGGTLTSLASFGNTNGTLPLGGLTLSPDGNFYGTTEYTTNFGGYGTIFRITPDGTLTTMAEFGSTNGALPFAGLTLGPDGNFYGTTYIGGSNGLGSVFRITTGGTLTGLANLGNTNGANPLAGLTLGPDGNFYGTTITNGSGVYGTVFRITTNGTLTTLAEFGNTNGAQPAAGLTLGPDGSLYGTTYRGGTGGGGVFFRLNLPPQPNCHGISNSGPGSVTLFLGDTPGTTNRLWTTTNLSLPLAQWQPILTNTADATWLFQFTDTNTSSTLARFYILSSP